MKIFYIPIEPYETRYTADWIEQFENEFDKMGIEYKTILGNTDSTTVTEGGVLDACGTHLFKFTQLYTLIRYIKSGIIKNDDVVFFADLWFPGLESLFYIRNMLNVRFKICGIFHAGTYDIHDFTYRNGMRQWGKYLEASWFSEIDKIFVATKFHKRLLLKNSLVIPRLADKIYVTGLPFYADKLRTLYLKEKEDIIVFPHRLDEEKHPELFDLFIDKLQQDRFNFLAIKTIEETNNREEYFNLLGKSKIMLSFADQETFGYSTLECMALDNIVIVPNKLSYMETVPREFRYDSLEDAYMLLIKHLKNWKIPEYNGCFNNYVKAVSNMVSLMV